MPRIYLSPPHITGEEYELVRDAIASNWVAPLGPHVAAFEREVSSLVGAPYAVAVSSGTAALHLALKTLGIKPGDEVICSSFTFVASASPIVYEGATPVFIDSESHSWNIAPDLLVDELKACAARGRLPRAIIAVDLYGQTADYDRILAAADDHGVPVIADAAEALGATYRGRMAGSMGVCGAFSFNGNKIITTSGGGMLVSHNADFIRQASFFATQAREPAPHYQHSVVGYNYRMSNLLAAVGRAQLKTLEDRIRARRRNFEYYRQALGELPGLAFIPYADWGVPNYWLTCITVDPREFGATREDVRIALEAKDIESRPVWKPLHLQPAFSGCRMRGGEVSETIFERGLCLPSGSALSESQLESIANTVRSIRTSRPHGNPTP